MRISPLNNTSGTQPAASLQKSLLLGHIIVIGLAYIQPMTLFDTFGMVSEASAQHVPTSYFFALLAVLFTAVSYGHMIKRYPSSGSAYTYVQRSIHPNAGFMVGWSSLLDYILSPMVNILLAVIYLTSMFPDVNHWVWVVGLTLFMTWVNLRGIKFVANLNGLIVLFQILVIVIFTFLIIKQLLVGNTALNTLGLSQSHNAHIWSTTPFFSEHAQIGTLIGGATILCFSFTGFDALSSLAEETHDTDKVLPRAIFLTALISGLIFIAATYFMQLYFPGNPSQYFADVNATQPDILRIVGGELFKSVILGFAIITVMASGISAHAGVSRLMYVMGRDGVFNKKYFGQISTKTAVPKFNIILVGIIALSAGFTDLDHVVSLISFGALTAFSFVNLSVLSQYALREGRVKTPKETFNYVVIPSLGFIAVGLLWLQIDHTALKWGIVWAVIGVLFLGYKTKGFKIPPPQYKND
ncbi:APC family permease [Acinetobacter pollinis]|uniref:APC family permease n=1 Tax=Acinetobacter pollinis TaxID=2605270 RepID=A0ABU6DPM0_9GAMM|nr:APC family permease [Acinetobacter pollinis]